jgi:flagellar biogenesis protein FliO
LGLISAVFLVLTAAIAIFIAAVWLGMHVIAPRLRRALDRAETEDEQDRDRYD